MNRLLLQSLPYDRSSAEDQVLILVKFHIVYDICSKGEQNKRSQVEQRLRAQSYSWSETVY